MKVMRLFLSRLSFVSEKNLFGVDSSRSFMMGKLLLDFDKLIVVVPVDGETVVKVRFCGLFIFVDIVEDVIHVL